MAKCQPVCSSYSAKVRATLCRHVMCESYVYTYAWWWADVHEHISGFKVWVSLVAFILGDPSSYLVFQGCKVQSRMCCGLSAPVLRLRGDVVVVELLYTCAREID
jgi:hypothetical protein